MNISKAESGRVFKKLDKIDELTKRIHKETTDIKDILKNVAENKEHPARRIRRKTPQKSKKVHSGGHDSDEASICEDN